MWRNCEKVMPQVTKRSPQKLQLFSEDKRQEKVNPIPNVNQDL